MTARDLIGRPIADALSHFLEREPIATLWVIEYQPRPGLLARARDPQSPIWSREALRHDRKEMARVTPISKAQFIESALGKPSSDGKVIGLCSRCELAHGQSAHLPMLDLQCEPSPQLVESIVDCMKLLGLATGMLVESGRSYHVYGLPLLSEAEWNEFMYTALLLYPLVDPRWIGHRLLDRAGVLRINAGGGKVLTPTVIEGWDPPG